MVGIRENRASLSEDLAVWFFDPTSGNVLDSTVIPRPGDLRILEVYEGPDDGFLVLNRPNSIDQDTIAFTYLNRDGSVRWEQSITVEQFDIDFEGIRDLSFVSPSEIVVSLNTFGSGVEIAPKLVRLTATEGVTETILFGENGGADIWSVECQPNGDLLLAGESPFNVFVALLSPTGTIRWRTDFDVAAGGFGQDRYEYLSDAHRPVGADYILATGRITDGRAVLIMDTLGNRLEESTLEDLFLIDPKEQVSWYGRGDTLFANYNGRGFSTLSITNDDGTSQSVEVEGFSFPYRARGSYYDPTEDLIVTALDRFGDIALSFTKVSELSVTITDVGNSGLISQELAGDVASTPNGDFLLLTNELNANNRQSINLVRTTPSGDVISRTPLFTSPFRPAEVIRRDYDNNYLAWNRVFDTLAVSKYSPDGSTLWSASLSADRSVNRRVAVSLPNDRFALIENKLAFVPGLGIQQATDISLGDSSGMISDTFTVSDVQELTNAYAGSEGDFVTTGLSSSLSSTRMINFDALTGAERWSRIVSWEGTFAPNVGDFIIIPSGGYGLALFNTANVNFGSASLVQLHHYSTEGEPLEVYDIPNVRSLISAPQTDIRGDTVTITFGESALDESFQPIDNGIRVHRFLMSTGEVLLDRTFPAFFGPATLGGVTHLADGRTAISATTPASDTSKSDDILLLVFDAAGNITNLRGATTFTAAVSISPNPTADQLNIRVSGAGNAPLLLQLFDANGRLLQRTNLTGYEQHQATLDLSTQAAGVYFVMLRNQLGATVTRRVIKQ